LEIRASEEDIRKYLKARISKAARLRRHVKADAKLEETIINTIVENSQGMYVQSDMMLLPALLKVL
jgi:hypothetical protein